VLVGAVQGERDHVAVLLVAQALVIHDGPGIRLSLAAPFRGAAGELTSGGLT
jgi:hypothetical protein